MAERSGLIMQRREIRSYVIRQGRMTGGQRVALEQLWDAYGIELESGLIDVATLFPQSGELIIEIGFGMGDSLFEMAEMNPALNFVGIEVHKPGVGHLLIKAADAGLTNLKVFNADTVAVVDCCLPDLCADRIQIFFPDPWHKKKHHKRRLINAEFATKLCSKLKADGILHVATDWPNYAEWIREVMKTLPFFEQVSPPNRPVTKYERRGLKLGHEVTDLAYAKVRHPPSSEVH